MKNELTEKEIRARMRELSDILFDASRAYYQDAEEIMSNYEYDALYDELLRLEKESGIVLAGSPTQKVGYEIVSELPKERHVIPMLSLDKTKDVEDLKAFVGGQEALISWKLDGLTVVLTYENGGLVKAVTRGNGEVGEVVTANARTFINLPLKIPFRGRLILRGEAVIGYSDFNKINEEIPEADGKYKNPRNLCSGSVRQLDSSITAKRRVQFYAFALVEAAGEAGTAEDPGPETTTGGIPAELNSSRSAQFGFLTAQGFDVVEHYLVTAGTLEERVRFFADKIASMDIPSDGLVLGYEDLVYGASLGRTAKFPRDMYAFKWADEIRETKLVSIEWSPSRTGLINPVAIFEPVELEGTTVSRASVHNVSMVRSLKLGIGDTVTVYKANMIIPQIAENLTGSGTCEPPQNCPACGAPTRIERVGDVETLYCTNPECPAKQIKSYALAVSRDALNIEGLSEATLEKFLAKGFLKEFADLYRLDRYKDEICEMEGMGERSYAKLAGSIEKSRKTDAVRVLYSMGIPGIGLATSKLISRHYAGDPAAMEDASREELLTIEGIGEVLADGYVRFWEDEKNRRIFADLLSEVEIEPADPAGQTEQDLAGKQFVITGSLAHFTNRKELQELLESRGAKVAGSVSKNTTYLVNNDSTSSSSKNKKAKELGIPVITEEELLRMLG